MHDAGTDDLVAGLAAGGDEAFAAVYDRFGRALFRVARALLRSPHDAEDAVQDVFLGLVRGRAALARVEDLRAYLFGALRHAAARRAARPAAAPLLAEPAAPAPAPGAELGDRLEWALARLPAEQREVVALKIDGGLTFQQVAAVVGVRPSTAASRYRYALEKLRALLGEATHAP